MYDGAKRNEIGYARTNITPITGPGWFEFGRFYTGSISVTISQQPMFFQVSLERSYYNHPIENHMIYISNNCLMSVIDKSYTHFIDKVRVCQAYYNDVGYVGVLEFHTITQSLEGYKVEVLHNSYGNNLTITKDIKLSEFEDDNHIVWMIGLKANSYFGGNETWPLS